MSVVPRGTDGAVSVVGTFAGVMASIFLAFIGCIISMVLPSFYFRGILSERAYLVFGFYFWRYLGVCTA